MAVSDVIEHRQETGISASYDAYPVPQYLSSSTRDLTMKDSPDAIILALNGAFAEDIGSALNNPQKGDMKFVVNESLPDDSENTDSPPDHASTVREQTKLLTKQDSCMLNGVENLKVSAVQTQEINGTESQQTMKYKEIKALLKKPFGKLELQNVPVEQVVSYEKIKDIAQNPITVTLGNEELSCKKLDTKQVKDTGRIDLCSGDSEDNLDSSSDETSTASEAEEEYQKIYDYTCDTCNKTFSLHYRLVKHIRTHLFHRKMYKCRYCPKELTTRVGRKQHERIHNNEKPYKCDECGECFRTKDFLESHKYKDHGHDLPYLCDICGMSFKRRTDYNNHITVHTGEKKYECNKCSKCFRRSSDLRKHIQINHQVLLCDICSATCASKRELQRHKMTHVKRAFPCDQCEASFSQNCNLTKHKLIHLGLKPYKCNLCSSKYAHKSNLNKHMKVAHNMISVVSQELDKDL